MTPVLVIVTTPDYEWQALYKDGNLVTQDHSITVRDVLEALGQPTEFHERELDPYGTCTFPDIIDSLEIPYVSAK